MSQHFIKTVLSLHHKQLPPSLHFDAPNPKSILRTAVRRQIRSCLHGRMSTTRLRAGVSSFGIGGTNIHVVLEEAPPQPDGDEGRAAKLVLLSAKTESGLEQATARLCGICGSIQASAVRCGYTLQIGAGRSASAHVRLLLCGGSAGIAGDHAPRAGSQPELRQRPGQAGVHVSGQGAQYVNMGLDLYHREPDFREAVDRCCDIVRRCWT